MNSPLREAAGDTGDGRIYTATRSARSPWTPLILPSRPSCKASQRPLLDLGCGMGLLAAYLRANGYRAPILGFDVDQRKIAIAQQVLGETGVRIPCRGRHRIFQDHSGILSCSMCFTISAMRISRRLLKKIAASIAPHGVALIRLALNERNWRFAATKFEEWFVHFSRWIPKCGWNFPTREEVLSPFSEEGLVSDIRPMWGLTPFNSHLFAFRRKD